MNVSAWRQFRKWALAVGLCLSLAVPVGAFAAPPAPEVLSLPEAINNALNLNPEAQAARHQVEHAASQVTMARSGLMPQVNVSESFNRTNSPLWAFGTKLNQGNIQSSDFVPDRLNNPDPIDNFNTALTVSWMLFDGGKTWIGWHQAQEGRDAAQQALRRSEQQVVANTAKAYVGLLMAREDLNVVHTALATARAHLKEIKDRFGNGMAVKSDVLRAQVRIADLVQQRLQAESGVAVAQAMLNAAMGRSTDPALVLTTPLEPGRAIAGTLEQWLAKALDNRPDLKALKIQEEIARKGIERSRAGHLPTFALQSSYEINSEDFSKTADNYSVGAVVQLNLFSGDGISAKTAAAKASFQRVRAMRQGLELAVRTQTREAFYRATSAWQSIDVARAAVLQAEEGLRIVDNRYQGGLLTMVSLLDAEVARQQALTQQYDAVHNYEVARIDLFLAAGVIDRDFP